MLIFFIACFLITLSAIKYLITEDPIDSFTPNRIMFKLENGERVRKMELKVDKNLGFTLEVTDKFGNATGALDGAPSWSSSDESKGSLEVSENGLSAKFKPNGSLGSITVSAVGQSGGKEIRGSIELSLIAGDAANIRIVAGEPESQEEKPAEEQPQEPV